MLTRLPNGDLEVSVRPPLIYLDHWALREISSDPAKREHFLETFRTKGTLMLSVVNILEMARNSGDSYERIRDLLDGVQPCWLLSDPDPRTVQDRENRGVLAPESFLVPLDILAMVFQKLPAGSLSLGSALTALQDQEFRDRAPAILAPPNGSEVLRAIRRERKRYERGEIIAPPPGPAGSPVWIMDSLLRFLIADNKKVVENDVIDVLHASVALRYAAIVLLDKAWANFARKLDLPHTQVFAKPQLDEALDAMRNADTSAYRVFRPDPPRIIKASG